MSLGASITRGVGGGVLVLAGIVLIGAGIAFFTGLDWVETAQGNGDDDQGRAGSDLVLGGAVAFGAAAGLGLIGGFLFFLGSSLLRRYEARMAEEHMPALPEL